MKARSDREPAKKSRDPARAPASPYPQPRGADDAAGGADGYETEPTRERKVRSDEDRRLRRNPEPDGETNQTA